MSLAICTANRICIGGGIESVADDLCRVNILSELWRMNRFDSIVKVKVIIDLCPLKIIPAQHSDYFLHVTFSGCAALTVKETSVLPG